VHVLNRASRYMGETSLLESYILDWFLIFIVDARFIERALSIRDKNMCLINQTPTRTQI
jgi:hypothetical protein